MEIRNLVSTDSAPVSSMTLVSPPLVPGIYFILINMLTKISRDYVEYILEHYSPLVTYLHWPQESRGGVIRHVGYVHVGNEGICGRLGAIGLGKRNGNIGTRFGVDYACRIETDFKCNGGTTER